MFTNVKPDLHLCKIFCAFCPLKFAFYMSPLAKILQEKGFNPQNFRPSREILAKLGGDRAPMTVRRWCKLVRGSSQMLFSEAADIANWLEVPIEHLQANVK